MFGGAGVFGALRVRGADRGDHPGAEPGDDRLAGRADRGRRIRRDRGRLALQGKSKVKAGAPPMPEQSTASVKADIESTKQHVKEGRQ